MPEAAQRSAYYRAALTLLRFVEHRAPTSRRFGPEADALWRSFAGDLDSADRIDLLLRDADRQWAAAFGPRAVFGLRAAHEQDAFGADWQPLTKADADALWRPSAAPSSATAALEALCEHWKLGSGKPFDPGKLGPSSRLVVIGGAAILATLRRCLADADLSWANQVVVIADEPGPRQLAAAAPALLDASEPTLLLGSDQVTPEARKRIRERLGASLELLASTDATPAEREAANRLKGG